MDSTAAQNSHIANQGGTECHHREHLQVYCSCTANNTTFFTIIILLSAYASEHTAAMLHPLCCICYTLRATQPTHIHIWQGCPAAGGSLPQDECFPTLGFELQPVGFCSPHSERGCTQHTPLVPDNPCPTHCSHTTLPRIQALACIPPNVNTVYYPKLKMAIQCMAIQASRAGAALGKKGGGEGITREVYWYFN